MRYSEFGLAASTPRGGAVTLMRCEVEEGADAASFEAVPFASRLCLTFGAQRNGATERRVWHPLRRAAVGPVCRYAPILIARLPSALRIELMASQQVG